MPQHCNLTTRAFAAWQGISVVHCDISRTQQRRGNRGYHVDEGMRAMWEQPEIKKLMKNTKQGAATTMWAAVGKEWEGKGGKYLDDCAVAGEAPEDAQMLDSGHSRWATDPEAAEKLWEVSLELRKPWREAA
eukprot:jgi/Ulvmu1/11403/UM075_0065.1